MAVNYRVIAKTRDEIRVSRHGISKTKGGQVVASEPFQFPDTPYYLACEIVADEHPGTDIAVVVEQAEPRKS